MSVRSNQMIVFDHLLCFSESIACVGVRELLGCCFSPPILLRLGFSCLCVARSMLCDLQASR